MYWCDADRPPEHILLTSFFPLPNLPPNFFGEQKLIISAAEFQKQFGIFFTFLGRRKNYRVTLERLGGNLARKLLSRANDIAVLQAFSPNSRVLKAARASGAHDHMIIDDEEKFTFLGVHKLFNRQEGLRDLPHDVLTMQAQLVIEKKTTIEITTEFEEVLGDPQPMNAIIGPNGAGKTRLLLALADCALKGKLVTWSRGQNQNLPHSDRPINVLSFTYEPSLWRKQAGRGATVIPLGVEKRNWKKLSTLLQRMAVTDRDDFSIRAYVDILRRITDPRHILVPVTSAARHPDLQHWQGQQKYLPLQALSEMPVHHGANIDTAKEIIAWSPDIGPFSLSSGQRSLVLMIAELFINGERSLVLFDEPENHLHPQFITMLMQTLQSTLVAMESRAVIVTHSPFVIRELQKSAVQILERDALGLPCLYQTSLQTFGADISRISEYVFGDGEIEKGFERSIDHALAKATSSTTQQIASQIGAQLGEEAAFYLRQKLKG